MADVFVSWSSADKDIVLPLSKALENAGFTVDEYSKDPSGGSIARNVRRYVDEARVAIVVLSADSVSKPWIQTEVDWCYFRRAQEGEELPEIIPLIVGDVPVPAAFLAMNQEQARALHNADEAASRGAVGMEPFPRLRRTSLARPSGLKEAQPGCASEFSISLRYPATT